MKHLIGGLGISSSKTTSNKKPNIGMIIVIIVVIILFIVLLNFLRTRIKFKGKKNKLLLEELHDSKKQKLISKGIIPEQGEGNEYNINFWLFLSDYIYRKDSEKIILYLGKNTFNCNPAILLLKDTNDMKLTFALQSNNSDVVDESCGLTDCSLIDSFIVEKVPLQKWVSVNISVNNNIVDVYFNGELTKSYELKGFPIKSNGNMYLTEEGGFNGFISKLEYSNYCLSNEEILIRYSSGYKN